MSDNDWIKELKRGDKVYTYISQYGTERYNLTKVKKVTPKGFIRVENDDLFRDGVRRTDDWTRYQLKKWTPELETKLNNKKILENRMYKLKNVDWSNVEISKINRIYEMLYTCNVDN